jgi:hypothetical protein
MKIYATLNYIRGLISGVISEFRFVCGVGITKFKQLKNTVVIWCKHCGKITTAFILQRTRVIFHKRLSSSLIKEQSGSLTVTTERTSYQTWLSTLPTWIKTSRSNFLVTWLTWRRRPLTSFPHLNDNPGGGSGAGRAIQNWVMIIVIAYIFGRPISGFFANQGKMGVLPTPEWNGKNAVVATPTLGDLGRDMRAGAGGVPNTNITVNVVYPTVQPTSTLQAQATPKSKGIDGQVYVVGYSYYNPDLLGINCFSGNVTSSGCADTTASGFRWSDYMRRGVAVPDIWLTRWGFGSVIRVLSPDILSGVYTIVDKCAACDWHNWTAYDKRDRVDFLDTIQRLPWDADVKFILESWVKP